MENKCKCIQDTLLDIHYKEAQWTERVSIHIAKCQECKGYWQRLGEMNEVMLAFDNNLIETDKGIIDQAFIDAEAIEKGKHSRMEFVMFMLIALVIIGFIGWLITIGYGSIILLQQVFLMMLIPFSLPIIIRQKLLKEGV